MPEEFTPRIGRKAAQTNLTDGESRLLIRLRAVLKTENDADTIRQALREKWHTLGWLS